jgi:hypothetical protein
VDYLVSPDDAEKLERLDDLLDTVDEPGADEAAEALARSLDDAELRAPALVRLVDGLASVEPWQRAEDVALSLEGQDVALSITEPSFRRKALIRVERAIRGRGSAEGGRPA